MRKILTIALLTIIFLLIRDVNAQEKVYLPIIFSEGQQMPCEYPILAISNGEETINLLDEGSGLQLADPYWSPNIAQLKGGGTFVDPQTADGRSLVSAQYGNVIETIPIRITGEQGWVTIQNLRRMLNLSVNAQSYWTQIFEQDRVWMEIKAKGDNFLSGYSTIYTISLPNITSPYTRPFANPIDKSQFDTINIILEREPFFSPLLPGEIIGPLYNLIKNPDFELWNFGIADSQPDSWDDLQTVSIVGTNNRYQTNPKWGNNAIQVSVTGSTAIGEAKGVTQVIDDTDDSTTYTILAWIKNDGISNGVGRILINYSNQLELYRDDSIHGWQLYSGTITTGIGDTVSINCQILSTANNTLGDVFFDGLMFIEGDWTDEAANNLIPYMSGSHIVNHWDQPENATVEAGDINFVDVWNIPGGVDSKIRLEMVNNTTPANQNNPIEIYDKVYIGMRRTGDIFNFTNYNDPPGIADTSASSDDKNDTDVLDEDWLDINSKVIDNNISDNLGRFKLLSRFYDNKTSGNPSLDARISYFVGASNINTTFIPLNSMDIRANWQNLDLTEDNFINFDVGKDTDTPSQIGYNIQVKRSDTATNNSFFDYSILMPTDGGFMDVDMNLPLTEGNFLLVDNTTKKLNVSASGIRKNTWIIDFEIDGDFRTFTVFRGILYVGGRDTTLSEGVIYRRINNKWELVFNSSDVEERTILDLEVYNGRLYAATEAGGVGNNGWILESSDGISFSQFKQTLTAAGSPLPNSAYNSLKSFEGKLWALSQQEVAGFDGIIESYDGTSWTTERLDVNIVGGQNFEVYDNKLFLSYFDGGDNYVDFYNPVTDTWTNSLFANVAPRFGLIFNAQEKLYMGTGGTATLNQIYIFDGANWTLKTVNTKSIPGDAIGTIIEYNGLVYATAIVGELHVTFDDDTWTVVFNPGFAAFTTSAAIIYDNTFFLAGDDTIYKYTTQDIIYKLSTYKGGGFSAPPRTLQSDSRHRYFFSYDRENFVNNIDDKALIGIGYRPRYFSLINIDPF